MFLFSFSLVNLGQSWTYSGRMPWPIRRRRKKRSSMRIHQMEVGAGWWCCIASWYVGFVDYISVMTPTWSQMQGGRFSWPGREFSYSVNYLIRCNWIMRRKCNDFIEVFALWVCLVAPPSLEDAFVLHNYQRKTCGDVCSDVVALKRQNLNRILKILFLTLWHKMLMLNFPKCTYFYVTRLIL